MKKTEVTNDEENALHFAWLNADGHFGYRLHDNAISYAEGNDNSDDDNAVVDVSRRHDDSAYRITHTHARQHPHEFA